MGVLLNMHKALKGQVEGITISHANPQLKDSQISRFDKKFGIECFPFLHMGLKDLPLVLIVDDESMNQRILRAMLGDSYCVIEAENGIQA